MGAPAGPADNVRRTLKHAVNNTLRAEAERIHERAKKLGDTPTFGYLNGTARTDNNDGGTDPVGDASGDVADGRPAVTGADRLIWSRLAAALDDTAADALLPIVLRYGDQRAAEALTEAAYDIGWPDPRGMWRAADYLRKRAATLTS